VSDVTTELVGNLLEPTVQKDAVHFAVIPMEAIERLSPGQRVGKDDHGHISGSQPHIGIVDPFLTKPVLAGQRCFLFLFPNTITSLRHEWTHPAFNAKEISTTASKSASEQWMRAWAMEHVSDDYYGDDGDKKSEDDAFNFAIEAGHEKHIGPYESAREHIDSEWWSHWETITGKRGDREAYFSCGC
jgi:hypothetical protein